MPVNTIHDTYAAHEKKARRVRDAVAGSDAIKARGTVYLRDPDPTDPARYKDYKEYAQWLGVTKRTHDGMMGAVFRKAPEMDLPAVIQYLIDDADGSGMSLTQFARGATSKTVINGRHGILVDYPEAEDGLTREQTQGLRATLRHYASESIINWRRAGEDLVLIVLRETYEDAVDEFSIKEKEQFRVLSLDAAGYRQRVYRGEEMVADIYPRMASGDPWPLIPFQFIGTVNNDEVPDNPLLLDIADLNIGHYRNSADLEESAFIVGQPMPHVDIGELAAQDWKELNPNGIKWGSRAGIQTKGGKLELIQAEPNSLPKELMEQKEAQMLSIGARLIEQRGGNETAEAVRARSGAENANLSTVADNVSDGMENCLEWAALFMTSADVHEQIRFRLNQEFYEQDADPQMVIARIQELDRGLIAKKDYRDWRRKTGGIAPDRTDEEIDDEVQAGGLAL